MRLKTSGRSRLPAGLGRGAALLVFVGALSGCGNTLYAVQANSAATRLEEARQAGAEQSAPYEYWYAKLHLEKASSEASEADYSDAAQLAEIAEEYAIKATRLAKEAQRGAGR